MAGVNGQQKMLTPPWQLILHLFFERSVFALLLFWFFSFVLLILNTVNSTCHIQVLLASDYMNVSSTNLIYSFVFNVLNKEYTDQLNKSYVPWAPSFEEKNPYFFNLWVDPAMGNNFCKVTVSLFSPLNE